MKARPALLLLLLIPGVACLFYFALAGPRGSPSEGPERTADPEPKAPAPAVLKGVESGTGAVPSAAGESSKPGRDLAGGDPRTALVGVVRDERRKPRAGVTVTAIGPDGGTTWSARSDDAGRFRVEVPRPVRGFAFYAVEARVPSEGLAGASTATISSGQFRTVDVGTLSLARTSVVEVVTLDASGRVLAGAEVMLCRAGEFGYALMEERATDGQGRARFSDVPPGAHRLLGVAEGHGRGAMQVHIPVADDEPFRIRITEARTLTVEVVEHATRTPVAGIGVRLLESVPDPEGMFHLTGPYLPAPTPPPTDADGRVVLEGLSREARLGLEVDSEAYVAHAEAISLYAEVPQDAPTFRLEVDALATVSWPVTAGERPVPAEGTGLMLRPRPGAVTDPFPTRARLEEGRIVARGCGPQDLRALAVAPDGSLALLERAAGAAEGAATSFQAPRSITVHVHEGLEGAPDGSVVYATDRHGFYLGEPAELDAEGQAAIRGLYRGTLLVYLAPTSRQRQGVHIGTVDVSAGDAHLDVDLAPRLEIVLQVVDDGERRLPPSYRLLVDGKPVQGVEEEPDAGRLRLRTRPPAGVESLTILLEAGGRISAQATVPTGETTEPLEVELRLESAGALVVSVDPPEDGGYGLVLLRWNERHGRWWRQLPLGRDVMALPTQPTEGNVHDFRPLLPGRYRVVDDATRASSREIEVRGGGPTARVRLDLSRVGWAQGVVRLPDGFDPETARVGIDLGGSRSLQPHDAMPVAKDGTFYVRVPGSRAVRLRAWHPVLTPHETEGFADVTRVRTDLQLRLVRGPEAAFRLIAPAAWLGGRFPGWRAIVVHLVPASGESSEASTHAVDSRDGANVFGGFQVGTYEVWIDAAPCAPLLLSKVKLGPERTDLGTVSPTRGATLRLRLKLPKGEAPPGVTVRVVPSAPPYWTRSVITSGTDVVEVPGLGPGRLEVTAALLGGRADSFARRLDREIESNGESDIEVIWPTR